MTVSYYGLTTQPNVFCTAPELLGGYLTDTVLSINGNLSASHNFRSIPHYPTNEKTQCPAIFLAVHGVISFRPAATHGFKGSHNLFECEA